MGALTSLYAGTNPDLTREVSGAYFMPWARRGTPMKGTQDVNLAMKLWEFLDHDIARSHGDETSERQT